MMKITKILQIIRLTRNVNTKSTLFNIRSTKDKFNLFFNHRHLMKDHLNSNQKQGPFSDNWKPSFDYLKQVLIGILLGDGHL